MSQPVDAEVLMRPSIPSAAPASPLTGTGVPAGLQQSSCDVVAAKVGHTCTVEAHMGAQGRLPSKHSGHTEGLPSTDGQPRRLGWGSLWGLGCTTHCGC